MIRTVRYIISLLILGILLYYIYLNREALSFAEIFRYKKTIGASILMLAATFLACGYGWVLILRSLKLTSSTGEALRVWFLSQLGKYLPGKVWVAAGRLYLFPGKGERIQVGYSILLELILVNVTGVCVFLFTLTLWDRPIPGISHNAVWAVLVFPCFLVLLHPKLLEKTVNGVLRRMKRKTIKIHLRVREIFSLFFYYLFCWVLYGLAFGMLASAFAGADLRRMAVFGGIYVFSIVIGFVTVVAPSGLGVREGVLFVLLSPYLEAPVATYLAVVSRLWFTLVELGMVAFFMLWSRREPVKTETVVL